LYCISILDLKAAYDLKLPAMLGAITQKAEIDDLALLLEGLPLRKMAELKDLHDKIQPQISKIPPAEQKVAELGNCFYAEFRLIRLFIFGGENG
jgi:hypothetical protein